MIQTKSDSERDQMSGLMRSNRQRGSMCPTQVKPWVPVKILVRNKNKSNVKNKSETVLAPRELVFLLPGQWGTPTVGLSAFVGMLTATLSSIVESVGDYIATANVCEVSYPPNHAINRRVAVINTFD